MIAIFVLLLFSLINANVGREIDKYSKTLHGVKDPPLNNGKTVVIEAKDVAATTKQPNHKLHTRSVDSVTNDTAIVKINYLNDTHKQLMVHWVGEGSNVIICLAKDPALTGISGLQQTGPSAVYISYDYGDTYVNKTDKFKLTNGSYATLDKFYNHPKYNTHFVFTDTRHNLIYTTTNHGRDIKRINLNFTPSELYFHELQPTVFVIWDKNDPDKKIWITEDYGQTFRFGSNFIKSVHWMKQQNDEYELILQRITPVPNGNNIIHSSNLFQTKLVNIYSTKVKDFFIKNDYIFTTKQFGKNLELYVSYKLGKQMKCIFDTQLDINSYFIVDVTSNRALVAVSHLANLSNLYVSENLDNTNNNLIHFTLSLENVFCYFPNYTWHDTWIQHVSEDAFADVYKVEGLTGIYIASHVLYKPFANNIGPPHLGSVITFDHGRSWRLIQAPMVDVEGQLTVCSIHNNCSLHLSQKLNQLYPDTRSITILSSKSAPGIIIATGVLGKSLKGHYGVYVSTDAGVTWRQILRDLFFFNMGDHGGILTAVKYFKNRGETRHILYSTDEGETWQITTFHDEDIRFYGLMTEPGENTTVFTMFGSLPEAHQWIIIKLDLLKAFKYNCTKDDYKLWHPSQSDENRSYIPCILGQQLTYQRRMPHANCYNGQDFDAPISVRPCDCDVNDFECDFGFVKSVKPGHCVRNETTLIDPYRIPENCKAGNFYLRTKGYRKIQGDVCIDGFKSHYLPDLIPCPFNEVDDFLLFAQRERISRYNLMTKTLQELPIKKLKNVIAIDFDLKNNCVYWADIALDTIGRQCFNNNSEPEILVASDLASIEGMALDWITNTLYFVDGLRSKIELIRTDINHSGRMRRTVLGPEVLKKPRGIALHPKAGYMFWTDWSAENPSVNRANLDGSNYIKLFGKSKVEWPNGITIDYIAERIYWVDARQDYIASSDLHGDFFKLIISQDDVVSHPFAVAVFKNNMYWDDWKRNAIFTSDKDSFRGVEVLLKQLPGLMDLKVYAHGIQIGTNACLNTTCDYICVGAPKNKFSCLCPDGMEMKNGKCLCPGGVQPFTNSTCPQFNNTCSPEHFTCSNSFCIPKGWRCDGEDDCGDMSDEVQCGTQTCPTSHFVCGDGKCLPHYWRCDYEADCSDGSDELNCPKQNCTEGQFTCKNGRCIAARWKCDGENDCRDESDEQNCTPPEPTSCKNSEFQCKGGGLVCIPPTWRCDGEKDCRDGSDELNCTNNKCLDHHFSCGPPSNRCIYSSWVCDGDKDCPEGQDEKNCTTTQPEHDDDITDKFISKNGNCHEWMFKCNNDRCIPYWWKCDLADDCGDGSDELGCNTTQPNKPAAATTTIKPAVLVCGINQFQCAQGGRCIFSSWVCDGTPDCLDGEDEHNCEKSINCTPNQFKCRQDGTCIPQKLVCNQHIDCPDGSDELICEHNLPNGPATPSCSIGYFPCDGNSCFPLATLCDGKIDCKDGYDEEHCTKNQSRIYQVLQMGVDERGINESSLFLYWWIATPNDIKFEYLPSISKVGNNEKWTNKTWTMDTSYGFTDLQPFTKYNITIYVRIQNQKTIFPPAKYYIATTTEGIPSEPWNVTAKQQNGSHVLLTWNKPAHPNGQIVNYQICWYPPLPPIKLKLNGNETAHLLTADFQKNVTYTFYIIAHNRRYESKSSEVTTLQFDGDSNMNYIENLNVVKQTDNTIQLSWSYPKKADGFTVILTAEKPYPKLPIYTTKTHNITISNLAPGTFYYIKVNAFKKSFIGPESYTSAITSGTKLPEVSSIQAIVIKEIGTTVKLSWDRPKDARKLTWVYGVYYGIDEEQLFEKTRFETVNQTAVIANLQACEIYIFSVGIIGPIGYGPLSNNSVEVNTSPNKRAPPKRLTVKQNKDNPLEIKVEWIPSCPSQEMQSYVIRAYDRETKRVWLVNKMSLEHVFNVAYGAVYDISVATDDPEAIYSENVTYHSPPILPPYEVKAFVESNGSYIVYWQERDVPKQVGNYKYEVLVCEGNEFNESKAERFYVNRSTFIYTNQTGNMYTFAVRIQSDNGYKSLLSERVSMALINREILPISENSLGLVLSLTFIGLLIAVILLVFIFVKHRRLQNSFTRFASSHYDTRSGAATFDDNNGLEDEDSPQITGFSDDEPLVIA